MLIKRKRCIKQKANMICTVHGGMYSQGENSMRAVLALSSVWTGGDHLWDKSPSVLDSVAWTLTNVAPLYQFLNLPFYPSAFCWSYFAMIQCRFFNFGYVNFDWFNLTVLKVLPLHGMTKIIITYILKYKIYVYIIFF